MAWEYTQHTSLTTEVGTTHSINIRWLVRRYMHLRLLIPDHAFRIGSSSVGVHVRIVRLANQKTKATTAPRRPLEAALHSPSPRRSLHSFDRRSRTEHDHGFVPRGPSLARARDRAHSARAQRQRSPQAWPRARRFVFFRRLPLRHPSRDLVSSVRVLGSSPARRGECSRHGRLKR